MEPPGTNKFVINLSKFPLSKDQISLLSKGLNFCPTPGENNPGLLRSDLDNLHRKLRLLYKFNANSFEDSTTLDFDPSPSPNLNSIEPFSHRKFKLKSMFNPVGPPPLEAMILSNEHALNTRAPYRRSYHNNLTPGEHKALKELQNIEDIIIKPADKGSAVVVMNKSDYLKEGLKQLSNPFFYQKVKSDLTEKHRLEVQSFIEQMYNNDEIDLTVINYLRDQECRTSQLYLLPKIHKGIIPPPGRPIVSANGCPTEKISQLVDHFLNPPTTLSNSYVKDTTHFLQKMSNIGPLPANCLLVTLDIVSLYTNVPNAGGLNAARQSLANFRPDPNVRPSNESIIHLLELVLTMNNFDFHGDHYIQVGGVAMGTKLAPSYAITYMNWFEETYVYTHPTQPLLWLRFIDDIYLLWDKSRAELDTFFEYLNSCTPNIKFTMEVSEDSVTFLDTTVKVIDNQLVTDLYTKPTDSHNYLWYTSAHPRHCKDSIPYSQFLRIRRICSRLQDFDKHVVQFAQFFRQRGYPLSLIEEAAIKARRLDRDLLLTPQTGPQPTCDPDNNIIMVNTYHPHDNSLKDIVKHNWGILGKSHKTNFLYKKHLMIGYRRPPNLRDLLVKADCRPKKPVSKLLANPPVWPNDSAPQTGNLKQTSITSFFKKSLDQHKLIPNTESTTDLRTSKQSTLTTSTSLTVVTKPPNVIRNHCTSKKCRYCPQLDKTGQITCTATGNTHPCKKNITCRSSNLVYAITCHTCKMQYVGQTKRTLLERFQGHFGSVTKAMRNKANGLSLNEDIGDIGCHFSDSSHSGIKDFNIQVLDFCPLPPHSERALEYRLRVEKYWIHRLRCPAPIGLNIFD